MLTDGLWLGCLERLGLVSDGNNWSAVRRRADDDDDGTDRCE